METKTPIMEQLNKKAHPDGFMNFRFVLSKAGERDYKNSQLCIQYSSFRIEYGNGIH